MAIIARYRRTEGSYPSGKHIHSVVVNMYAITEYTRRRARELGVEVRPSRRKGKKIDVYKNNVYVVSVGAIGYTDFPTMKKKSVSEARKRQQAYHSRHRQNNGVAGFYARRLLW